MGEAKRRKAILGDKYGQPSQRWEVDKLLVHLIEDNYETLVKLNAEGFKAKGKGVVMALYPEPPQNEEIFGELSYCPKTQFLEAMEQQFPISKYPKLIPGASTLLETYDPSRYLVLGLFGAIKPFVMLLTTQGNPQELVQQIQKQVDRELSSS